MPIVDDIEEIDAANAALNAEEGQPEGVASVPYFCIDTEDRANWYLRKLANLETEKARVKAQAESMIKSLEAETSRLRARFEVEFIDFTKGQIATRASKKKSFSYLQGTVSFRTVPGSVRIANATEALEYAKAQGWDIVRTTESLDSDGYKREALAAQHETGELLPGLELVPARESFSIKFGGKDEE